MIAPVCLQIHTLRLTELIGAPLVDGRNFRTVGMVVEGRELASAKCLVGVAQHAWNVEIVQASNTLAGLRAAIGYIV